MADLRFDFEWTDPETVRGSEFRATWARLAVQFDGKPITRVFDRYSKSVRESIYIPLYPLAEWIATHWWFIFAEVETPGKQPSGEYERRHSIRFGQDGYSLPNLLFRPVGTAVQLQWFPFAPRFGRVEFLGEGSGYLDNAELAATLSGLVEAVLQRLEEQNVRPTLLGDEWAAVQRTDDDERAFCVAAASMGVDPYSAEPATVEAILSASQALPATVLPEFFPIATPASLQAQVALVLGALTTALDRQWTLRRLLELRNSLEPLTVVAHHPWQYGYEYARQLRGRLGLDGNPISSFEQLSIALGLSTEDLLSGIALGVAPGTSLSLDAVLGVGETGVPGFAVAPRSQDAVRFSFCRALFEYFAGHSANSQLVTRAHSDRQKRNRAFAAEFLLPAETLRHRVHTNVVSEEFVEDIACEYGVSTLVVRHQLENHRISRVELA